MRHLLKLFYLSLLLGLHLPLHAQLERSQWFFGENVGFQIGFSNSCFVVPPIYPGGKPICSTDRFFPLTNADTSLTFTPEGTSSIADFAGNLLFYTDGISVWNKEHKLMQNGEGLLGSLTSTQSALIVPLPNTCDEEFYIFTVGQGEDENNFYYSRVDMRANGGLGAVIEKNTLVQRNVTERVTAVFHQNRNDYWIIVHEAESRAFYTYLLDPSGFNTAPVISNAGSVHEGICGSIGYMRGSPNSLILAVAISNCAQATRSDRVEVFPFNPLTGKVGLSVATKFIPNVYGLEFSASSRFLYTANWHGGFITQHELQSRGNFTSHEQLLGIEENFGPNGINNSTGALLRAHNGNIYAAINNTEQLGVIPNADSLYTVSSRIPSPYFNRRVGKGVKFGLPNLAPERTFKVIEQNTENCQHRIQEYWIDSTNIDSVQWTFADNFQFTGFQVMHRVVGFEASCVKARIYKCGLFYDIFRCLEVESCVEINQDVVCSSQEGIFSLTNTSANSTIIGAFWDFGGGLTSNEKEPRIVFPNPGEIPFTVTVTWDNGFMETLLDTVEIPELVSVDLGPDKFVCREDTQAFPIGLRPSFFPAFGDFLWQDGSDSSAFEATEPGIYWVEYSKNGCLERDSIRIEEFSLLTFPQEIKVCYPDTQIIDLTFLEADSILWEDGTRGPLYPVSEAGNYRVQLFKGVCEVSDSIQVEVEEPPFLQIGQDTTVCEADFLLLNAFIPQALSYTWQDGSTGPFFTATESGFYKVQIQTQNCFLEDSIRVVFLRNDDIPDRLGCDDSPLTLDAFIPGATYLWQDGSVKSSILADTAGTYWVEISRDGCTVRDSIELRYDPALSLELGADSLLCFDETLSLDVSQPGASYEWSDGFSGPIRQITQSGTYTVTLNRGACSITDSVRIDILNLNLGPDQSYCTDDTLVLNAFNPGASYLWQDGSTDSVFLATQSGQYFVQVSRDGCVLTDTITVDLISPPRVDLGPDTLLCESQVLTLDAFIENASFRWQDGSTNPIFEVTESGIYWVDVVRGGGCVVRDSIEVEILDIDLGPDQIACGDSLITLSAYFPGAIYVWSNGSTDSVLTVRQSGTYWVELTKQKCQVYDTIQITIEAAPVLELGPDTVLCEGVLELDVTQNGAEYLWQDGSSSSRFTISESGTYWIRKNIGLCEISDSIHVQFVEVDLGEDRIECLGSTVILDASLPIPGVSYTWQDGSSLPFYEVSQAGEYWVEVAFEGCTKRDTVNIGFTEPPQVDLGADTILCEGSLSLDVSFPGASYLWQDGSTDSVYTISQSGTYSVTLNIGNCTRSDEIRVDILQVDLGPDRTVCNDELVVLDASQSLPEATYLWQDGSTQPVLPVSQSGTYWVEISYQTCVFRDSVDITLVNPPLVNLGADTLLCDGEILSLDVDQAGASFLWQDGSSLPTFEISRGGQYWVEVGIGACIRRDSLFVETLEVDLGPDLTLCQGESQSFNVFQEGASYLWQDGSRSPFFRAESEGLYWVELSKGSCTVRDSLVLSFTQRPQVELGPNDTLLLCGESLLLDASQDGAEYLWQDGSIDAQFLVTKSGLYTVDVRRGNCTVSEQIFVQFPFLEALELGPDSAACQDSPYILRAPAAGSTLPVSYLWSTGSDQAEIEVSAPGEYWVAISSGGCTLLDTVNLEFVDCEIFLPGTEFFVPNVITPNNKDGKNDSFVIDGISLGSWSLRIYNRWGNQVYETLDYRNDWTAEDQVAGTYYYQLSHPQLDKPFQGWILVMK